MSDSRSMSHPNLKGLCCVVVQCLLRCPNAAMLMFRLVSSSKIFSSGWSFYSLGPFNAYFFKMMKIKIFVDIVRSKGALLSIKEDLKNRG